MPIQKKLRKLSSKLEFMKSRRTAIFYLIMGLRSYNIHYIWQSTTSCEKNFYQKLPMSHFNNVYHKSYIGADEGYVLIIDCTTDESA